MSPFKITQSNPIPNMPHYRAMTEYPQTIEIFSLLRGTADSENRSLRPHDIVSLAPAPFFLFSNSFMILLNFLFHIWYLLSPAYPEPPKLHHPGETPNTHLSSASANNILVYIIFVALAPPPLPLCANPFVSRNCITNPQSPRKTKNDHCLPLAGNLKCKSEIPNGLETDKAAMDIKVQNTEK